MTKKITDFSPALVELAMNDAVVHYALIVYLLNDQTVEQTLTQLVFVLADLNQKKFDLIVKMHQTGVVHEEV